MYQTDVRVKEANRSPTDAQVAVYSSGDNDLDDCTQRLSLVDSCWFQIIENLFSGADLITTSPSVIIVVDNVSKPIVLVEFRL